MYDDDSEIKDPHVVHKLQPVANVSDIPQLYRLIQQQQQQLRMLQEQQMIMKEQMRQLQQKMDRIHRGGHTPHD